MTISVILLAGGISTRMKASIPKQFLALNGKPIVLYSFDLFARCSRVSEIIVVCEKNYRSLFHSPKTVGLKFADPGPRRQDSVFSGLQQISEQTTFACIHDSARPFLTLHDLGNVFDAATEYGAATLATPAKNTIKEVTDDGFIAKTLDRSKLWEMLTPQVIEISLLKKGFAAAELQKIDVTDDTSLLELINHPVKIIRGDPHNLKITTPSDWQIAETYTAKYV